MDDKILKQSSKKEEPLNSGYFHIDTIEMYESFQPPPNQITHIRANMDYTIIIWQIRQVHAHYFQTSIFRKIQEMKPSQAFTSVKFMNTSNELLIGADCKIMYCKLNEKQNDWECLQILQSVSKFCKVEISSDDSQIIIVDIQSAQLTVWVKLQNSQIWTFRQSINGNFSRLNTSLQQLQTKIGKATCEFTCRFYLDCSLKWKYFYLKKFHNTYDVFQIEDNCIVTITGKSFNLFYYNWNIQGKKIIQKQLVQSVQALRIFYCKEQRLLFACASTVLWIIKIDENNQLIIKDKITYPCYVIEIELKEKGKLFIMIGNDRIYQYLFT